MNLYLLILQLYTNQGSQLILHRRRAGGRAGGSSRGLFLKKGIIRLFISEKLNIVKTNAGFPGYLYILPDPK